MIPLLLLVGSLEPLLQEGDVALVLSLEDRRLVFEHGAAHAKPLIPGSVMKLFTAYALLETGTEQALLDCRGQHVDPFQTERSCWLRSGHGPMNLRTAIAHSCNVWFYEHTVALPDERLLAIYKKFGFGDLPAAIPPADLPDVAVGDHPAVRVTPLELLHAVAVIALRGRGTELDPRYLELIAEGMAEAAKGGTLAGLFSKLDVAAKTGTAKKERGSGTRGLVLGFFPTAKPKFAFLVIKERGRGATDAGPVAAALVREHAR